VRGGGLQVVDLDRIAPLERRDAEGDRLARIEVDVGGALDLEIRQGGPAAGGPVEITVAAPASLLEPTRSAAPRGQSPAQFHARHLNDELGRTRRAQLHEAAARH
jgi:hypothetical protein